MSPSRKRFPLPDEDARQAATRCPPGKPIMFQSWQNLLFLHWPVPSPDLENLLPQGLHLDTYQGQAWLGIVPFFMRDVRPRFFPAVPGISNFMELNVRTYIYDDSGVPGVWFFSLDANLGLACALGRSMFHLPYWRAEMDSATGDWIDYTALRHGEEEPADYRYRGVGSDHIAKPGSLEFFLLERYVLYSHDPRRNRLWRGRVHHAPYRFRDADVERFSMAPLVWGDLPAAPGLPAHACTVPRVDVAIHGLNRIETEPGGKSSI